MLWKGCLVWLFFLGWGAWAEELRQAPSGDSSIRAKAGSSEIVVTTTDRLAGAIHSLTWGGKEFIDSADHGRQLQSAASFDCALPQPFWPECYNPTEAGSRLDGAGEKSSSRLLQLRAEGPELETTTQMAFWLAPGEKSQGRMALNNQVLSDHRVSKRIHLGYNQLAGVLDYRVKFTVPNGERHTLAQFEALTGYMPAEFGQFWKFVPSSGKLEALDSGPGEQPFPVLFSTAEGAHAMGIFAPETTPGDYERPGYGRFRFPEEKVVKWNCVFRLRDKQAIPTGDHSFHLFVAVGSLKDVRDALATLASEFPNR